MGFYNEVYMTTSPLYTEEEIKNIVHVLDNAKQKFEETKDKKYLELNKVLEIRNYCMNEQWRDPHFLTFYMLLMEVGERLQDNYRIVWRMPALASEQKDCSGWVDWNKQELHFTDTKNRQSADVGLTDEAITNLKRGKR